MTDLLINTRCYSTPGLYPYLRLFPLASYGPLRIKFTLSASGPKGGEPQVQERADRTNGLKMVEGGLETDRIAGNCMTITEIML